MKINTQAITSILDNVVFLDLETSGLKPEASEILEIGAVKISDKKVFTFDKLVKNKSKVLPEIFSLCKGLNQKDLDKAPTLEEIKEEFLAFIEDKPIICHNKAFEMSFLNFHIGNIKNKFLDSMELAVVLEPYHREFNLDYLKKTITTSKDDEIHRALSDSIDTVDVVNSLILRFKRNLEKENRLTLYPLTFDIDSYLNKYSLANWDWSEYINSADFDLEKSTKVVYERENILEKSSEENDKKELYIKNLLEKDDFKYENLLRNQEIWAAKKGFIYEFRKGQYDLTESIRMTFDKSQSNILCMEAPTGIGKSVGYLLPAVLEAKYNKKRIIISTATKELQVQLIQKDLPNVINSLGLENKVTYGYIKGKNNYICKKKFDDYKKNYKTDKATYDEILSILIIDNLIKNGEYADIEEINYWAINHFEYLKKHLIKVSCDVDLCKPKKCTEVCLYKTRVEELIKEDITVINHSLLAKWPYIDEKPLENIIVDEAHNLVEKGYDFFSSEIDCSNFKHFIAELYPYEYLRECHLLNKDMKSRKIKLMDRFYEKISLDREDKRKISTNFNFILENLNSILDFAIENDYNLKSSYGLHWELNLQKDEKILNTEHTYNAYSELVKMSVEPIINNIKSTIFLISKNMDDDLIDKESEQYKYGKSRIKNLEDIAITFEKFLEYDENDLFARIVDINKSFNNFTISVVPLNLDELFREKILSILENGIFISATLSVDNKMDYFINALGIDKVKNVKKIIEPIYDYKRKLEVIRVSDMGGYRSEDFIDKISTNTQSLIKASNSNILCLFNSKKRQDETYDMLEDALHKNDISIYTNKKGIKFLKNVENRSVVLGSKGCFEGVDVPGDGLVCVTLDKIPNLNPKDPLYYSIMEKFRKNYVDVNYPQMIIKVKQALGRILRSKYDYGVFVMFDIGSNLKITNKLEQNLHGCRIVNVRSCDLELHVQCSIERKRRQLIISLIKELVRHYRAQNIDEDLVDYINREIKNRSINAAVKRCIETNKIRLEYYNIRYIVDIDQI